MTLQEATRGQRDRHAGEDHADQRGQAQETLRTLDGAAKFRARLAYILDPLPGRQARRDEGPIARNICRRTGQHQAMTDPARRLHQPRFRQVECIHHDPRRHRQEADAGLGVAFEHPRDREGTIAEVDRLTTVDAEQRHHAGIHPDRAPRGDATRGHRRLEIARGQRDVTLHRIAVADGAYFGQLRTLANGHHARETQYRRQRQAQPHGLLHEQGIERAIFLTVFRPPPWNSLQMALPQLKQDF